MPQNVERNFGRFRSFTMTSMRDFVCLLVAQIPNLDFLCVDARGRLGCDSRSPPKGEGRGSWRESSPEDALFCPIDFKKAFDSVSHDYTRTFLNLMQLPDSLISLCLLLFTAPICVLVRDHIYTDHKIHPRSGVRQGCPFSPSIFAMLISPIIHKLMDLSDHVQVLLYADDLIIIIDCDPNTGVRVFLLVWSRVQEFSTVTGLYTNLDKSNILLKGQWDPIHGVQLLSTGLKIVDKYKYLGIVLGATSGRGLWTCTQESHRSCVFHAVMVPLAR